jgi:hypothetical protein
VAEKPIIFSGPMVRAIIEGRKTQTRRVLKPQPQPSFAKKGEWLVWNRHGGWCGPEQDVGTIAVHYCPITVGTELWVRETFIDLTSYMDAPAFQDRTNPIAYRADGDFIGCHKWISSIHMPRTASRVALRVNGVRVERLQDISEADAIAEGVCKFTEQADTSTSWQGLEPADRDAMVRAIYGSARRAFQHLWESINGENSWQANPWVAVCSFERI